MTVVDRNNLYAGLVTKDFLFSFSYPRKIIFSYDAIDQIGYDIKNKLSYPLSKPEKYKGFYISNPIHLNNILINAGYPEKLEDVHIQHIMENDFEKIFVDSGVMEELYFCSMDDFSSTFYKNNLSILKGEFGLSAEEAKFMVNTQKKYDALKKLKRG